MNELTRSSHECRGCADENGPAALRDWAPDGIGRRTFLVQSGILAALAALTACGAGGDATAPPIPSNTTINVASYPALANVGGVAVLSVSGAPIAVVRTGTSTFLVLSRVCPHQGGTVQLSGNDFVCPVHGATFNLSGQWIGGQRTSSLRTYANSYDATSGTITIS
jgi:Rieske Fe-S protein